MADRYEFGPTRPNGGLIRGGAMTITDRETGRVWAIPAGGSTDEPTEEPTTEEPTPDPEPPAQEPDWKAEARKWEKRAKDNSDAAARLQKLEDAQKTEQEKLTEQLEAERATARTNAVEAARYRAAMKHGLSDEDLEWLGDDPDQIEDRAERLAARLAAATPEPPSTQRRPQEKLKPGTVPETEPDPSGDQLADAIWTRNRI